MIALSKEKIPEVLAKNADRWLNELKEAIAEGDKKKKTTRLKRYNHASVKDTLVRETHGKCAYCEAKVGDVANGDIEHVFPKSLDVDKTYEWSNLGFACEKCNQYKSNKNPDEYQIIDPYNKDPEQHLRFLGCIAHPDGDESGKRTIDALNLNRAGLIETRTEVFKYLVKELGAIQMARDELEKEILINNFIEEHFSPKREFSSMRKSFWQTYGVT